MTLSTVLHLGEISFVGVGNNDAAQVQNADTLKKGNLFNKYSVLHPSYLERPRQGTLFYLQLLGKENILISLLCWHIMIRSQGY